MNFASFKDVYGSQAYVNPDHVTHVRDNGNESTSIYVTGGDQPAFSVRMATADVCRTRPC
jgi:hypothetical protein